MATPSLGNPSPQPSEGLGRDVLGGASIQRHQGAGAHHARQVLAIEAFETCPIRQHPVLSRWAAFRVQLQGYTSRCMSVYPGKMARMQRTNVVIDQALLDKVMGTFGLETKRQAVDFALHAVLGDDRAPVTDPWKGALELRGAWADRSEEDLREIYGDEFPDADEDLGRR